MSGVVTNTRALDFDHVCAEVREELRAPGSGENTGKVEDPDALERFHARLLHGLQSANTACAAL